MGARTDTSGDPAEFVEPQFLLKIDPVAARKLSPPHLTESVPATDELAAFKRSGLALALVVDERDDIERLVTPADVLEALVGDLEEPSQVPIVRCRSGTWLVDGLRNTEELKERIGLSTPPDEQEEDYQTVGEVVMTHLTRVPAVGDRFEWEEFSFEVVDMDGHRVDKVLVVRALGSTPDDVPQG